METLDYLVAETAIHLDPILEVIELGEDSADGESDLSSKIDDWHCQVMRSWKHLLPFNCYLSIPRVPVNLEARKGLWFYSKLSNDYSHSFEEKFSFIQSYECKESCHLCSFGDTVAQNAQWVLDYHGPYPGDHWSVLNNKCDIISPWGRFYVEKYLDTHHVITDRHYLGTHLLYETLIWTTGWRLKTSPWLCGMPRRGASSLESP